MSKKTYGNKRRLAFFSIGAIVLIALVFLIFRMTLSQYKDTIIDGYRTDELHDLRDIISIAEKEYNEQDGIESIVSLVNNLNYVGEQFYILEIDGQVMFCKNAETTNGLGSLRDPGLLIASISDDSTFIDSEYFELGEHHCTLSVISTESYILSSVGYEQIRYSIFVLLAILAMALLSSLEITVGNWNRMVSKYHLSQDELELRNAHIESMSEALTSVESDRNAATMILDPDGIADVGEDSYYNVYTMRQLLEKTESMRELQPIHMITLKVDQSQINLPRETIFKSVRMINDTLSDYEVLAEVRKGLFVLLIYRVSIGKARAELKRINDICAQLSQTRRILIKAEWVERDGRSLLEIYDEMAVAFSNNAANGGDS